MTVPRQSFTATLLPNGLVLIAGGSNFVFPGSLTFYSSSELYNPFTREFSSVASSMAETRNRPAAILLQNGQVLISGGNQQSTTRTSADLFTPDPAVQGAGNE